MHELALTQRLVEIVEAHALWAERVEKVYVEIGALSGVVPDAVEFCFEACAKGTKAEGAELVIEQVRGRGWCAGCGEEFPMPELIAWCPRCEGFLEPTAGQEMRVREIEVRSQESEVRS